MKKEDFILLKQKPGNIVSSREKKWKNLNKPDSQASQRVPKPPGWRLQQLKGEFSVNEETCCRWVRGRKRRHLGPVWKTVRMWSKEGICVAWRDEMRETWSDRRRKRGTERTEVSMKWKMTVLFTLSANPPRNSMQRPMLYHSCNEILFHYSS